MCEEWLKIENSKKKKKFSHFIIFQAGHFCEPAECNESMFAELSEQSAINTEVINLN